jgi:hypothetical protein
MLFHRCRHPLIQGGCPKQLGACWPDKHMAGNRFDPEPLLKFAAPIEQNLSGWVFVTDEPCQP